jgi:hypothetical protein
MKTFTIYIQIILVILLMGAGIQTSRAQRATAELITSLPTPTLEENIAVKDGERFVTYRDNYLFAVNFWIGIQVWDVSNIESPRKVSFLKTSDMCYHAALDQNRLYAANKAEGVVVFDISNIERPYELARIKTPGDAYWVDVNYPYLYVALGKEGFCVMDISNLSDPRTLSLEIPETWVWSLKYRDNKLYVAAKQGGLLIYDITNPSSLTKITQYKTGFHAVEFQLEDNLVYLADGPGGLLILDISAPRLPKEIGRFETEGFTHHVFKSGNYAYLSNREMGLLIVKVNDPAHPRLEARYVTDSETYASFKEDVYVFLSSDTKTEILRHNNQPEMEPLADLSIDENTNYALQLNASDPDGDAIYFEAQNLPPGSEFNTGTGLFTWTPSYEQSGVYPGVIFTVIEKTGSKLSDSDTISITVNHVNRLPELPSIANVTIPEDSLLTIQVPEGSDPDKEDTGKLTYRVENAPPGATFNAVSRVFQWKPTFEQSGVYIVDFVLDDGAGGVDREAVTVTVTHVDRAPVIAKISDQVVNENQPLSLTLSGEEPDKEDQDKISYSMFKLPAGATFNAATRQFSWTPSYEQSGMYEGIGAVMKAGKLSDTTYFTITVNHVNRPPVLAAIGDQLDDENKKLTFTISGSDPDKEDSAKLTYSAENLPTGAVFNPDSLKFSWTPTYEQSGVYSGIVFRVEDPQGLSDQKTITITINHVNRLPVLAEIEPQTVDENVALQVPLSATDPDREDSGKLTFSSTNLPQGATLDATSGLFDWTPGYDQSGQYQIKCTVSDGRLSDSKTMPVTVNHVNRPPLLANIENQTVNENTKLSFTISGSDPDREDEGKLVYSAQNLPAGATFNAGTLVFSWTPTYEQSGVYNNVLFRVTDPAGLLDEKNITIVVHHVNRAPALAAVPAITSKEEQPVAFTLQGSDPDREDKGKLIYSISNLPEGGTLNSSSGEFNWTPTYDQSGVYTLKAQVTDSAGLNAATDISVTIENVNRPPVAAAMEPVTGRENEPLIFTLQMSDPDKEDQGKLTVTSTDLPTGMQLDANNGMISWTPTFDQSGTYNLDYTVTDSYGATASGTVSVQIDNVNRPPELAQVNPLNGDENQALATVLPEANDPDKEDAGKLTYSLETLPAGATFDPATRSFQWTPTYDQAGTYNLVYRVSDTGGLSAQIPVKVIIANVNREPVLPTVATLETREGESFSQVLPEASDPDREDAGKLRYSINNLPPGANFNGGSRILSWTPRFDQAGEYTMTYKSEDPQGLSAETGITLVVENVNRAPSMKAVGNQSVREGEALSFTVNMDDPDGEDKGKVSLAVNNLPPGANFNGASRTFTWIPREDQQGNYTVTFVARDPAGATSEMSVNISVEDVPPPTPPEQND